MNSLTIIIIIIIITLRQLATGDIIWRYHVKAQAPIARAMTYIEHNVKYAQFSMLPS